MSSVLPSYNHVPSRRSSDAGQTEKFFWLQDLDSQFLRLAQLAAGFLAADQIVGLTGHRTARRGSQRYDNAVHLIPGVGLHFSCYHDGLTRKGALECGERPEGLPTYRSYSLWQTTHEGYGARYLRNSEAGENHTLHRRHPASHPGFHGIPGRAWHSPFCPS